MPIFKFQPGHRHKFAGIAGIAGIAGDHGEVVGQCCAGNLNIARADKRACGLQGCSGLLGVHTSGAVKADDRITLRQLGDEQAQFCSIVESDRAKRQLEQVDGAGGDVPIRELLNTVLGMACAYKRQTSVLVSRRYFKAACVAH